MGKRCYIILKITDSSGWYTADVSEVFFSKEEAFEKISYLNLGNNDRDIHYKLVDFTLPDA